MKPSPSNRFATLLAIAALFTFAGGATSRATNQPLFWSCANTDIVNLVGCTISFNLTTDPAGTFTPLSIMPCTTVPFVSTATTTRILGMRTVSGNNKVIEFNATAIPPVGPPCGPVPVPFTIADGIVRGVTLASLCCPGGNCCVDVYFFGSANTPACTIYIVPAAPGPCLP
jgi:hypothetical protein